jgi:glycosyltransferase involved in cell wall biosynthesis
MPKSENSLNGGWLPIDRNGYSSSSLTPMLPLAARRSKSGLPSWESIGMLLPSRFPSLTVFGTFLFRGAFRIRITCEAPMKIAQIAPLMESVAPKLYGGTERIVSHLTEELVAMGHQVTLFATGDSITTAKLVSCTDQAIRLNEHVQDPVPHYMIMLDNVRRLAHHFDVLHFHIDAFHFPLFREMAAKTITTLHGRQDLPDLLPLYQAFPEMPLVSISDAQRAPIVDASFVKTIYHGLPLNLYRPTYEPQGGYLAFLGRISREKRPDRAIAIAKEARLAFP